MNPLVGVKILKNINQNQINPNFDKVNKAKKKSSYFGTCMLVKKSQRCRFANLKSYQNQEGKYCPKNQEARSSRFQILTNHEDNNEVENISLVNLVCSSQGAQAGASEKKK